MLFAVHFTFAGTAVITVVPVWQDRGRNWEAGLLAAADSCLKRPANPMICN